MYLRFAAAATLLVASHAAFAGIWNLQEHAVLPTGNDVVIELNGGSSDSCIPRDSTVEIQDSQININLESSSEGCFFAFRPWTYAVTLQDLPNGSYDVSVLQNDTKIGAFRFDQDTAVSNPTEPVESAGAIVMATESFQPSEGMWWDSEKPGTGVAFNIDDQGRWFAAIYLYDQDGDPTFLTMQGESLAYDLSASQTASEPYAVAASPLILTEGGQCLKCPWTQTTVSDTGEDAELLFFSRTHAALVVGDWRLDLTLLPESVSENHTKAIPELEQHYSLMVDGPVGRHMLVVKGAPGGLVLTGQTSAALECVDCRSIDAQGQSPETLDKDLQELVEDRIAFLCTASNCSVSLDETVARTFIDKTDTVITTVIPGEGDDQDTYIELRKLPEGWRE